MKQTRKSHISLILVLTALPPVAGGAEAGPAERIRAIVGSIKPASMRIGVHVVEAASGAVIFDEDGDFPFKPASNMKVITAAAALDLLPADFRYRTVLAIRGSDLVVVGSGDPSLGDPKLAAAKNRALNAVFHDWAAKLQARGVTEVAGDLVIDDTVFESQRIHPNWDRAQLDAWYSAPVGGLNYNDNCIDVQISPGKRPGDPAILRVVPANTYVTIQNQAKTGSKQTATIRRIGNDAVYVVSGQCRSAATFQSIAVPDPGMLFASAMKTAFAAKGIAIHGKIRRERVRDGGGNPPAGCTVIATHESTLGESLGRMLKDSQNLFAECALKTIGFRLSAQETGHGEGSYATGRKSVAAFLQKIDAPVTADVVIDDGSGLSHRNRVTPRLMTHVLRYMAGHARAREFMENLPVAGEDGTLKRRMSDVAGRVRAKTGYINNVHALSGYAMGKSGRLYCFSVLTNEVKGGDAKARIDDICRALVNDTAEVKASRRDARTQR